MQAACSATLIRESSSCIGFRRELMQGIKIGWVGRTFAMAVPQDAAGHQKHGKRRTKGERRIMVESFVQKYRASNNGQFPTLSATMKEVGGSFYVVRQILQELIHEYKTSNTLGTIGNLDKQTRMDTVKPLSLPAESSMSISNATGKGVEHDCVLALEVENNQEASEHMNDHQNTICSDFQVICHSNNHTTIMQEKRTVQELPEKSVVSESLQRVQLVTEETSCEEDGDLQKCSDFGEKHNKESFNEHAGVSIEPGAKSDPSSEIQANYKFIEAQDRDIYLTEVMNSSAPSSNISAGSRLDHNTLEKKSVERKLEMMEVTMPVVTEVTQSCRTSVENLNSLEDFEETQINPPPKLFKPMHPTYGLQSSNSDNCVMDNGTVSLDSTENLLAEPENLAASVTSLPLSTDLIDAGDGADFREDVQTSIINVEVQGVDACQGESSKMLSERSTEVLSPINADESSDKTGNVALPAIAGQDQVERVGTIKESTPSNHNSEGISESISKSTNINSSSEMSESPEDTWKLQKGMIWRNLKVIANEIVNFWKKI